MIWDCDSVTVLVHEERGAEMNNSALYLTEDKRPAYEVSERGHLTVYSSRDGQSFRAEYPSGTWVRVYAVNATTTILMSGI